MNIQRKLQVGALAVAAGAFLQAQQTQPPKSTVNLPSSYVLGTNDQVIVGVVELPEFKEKSYRVESDGTVDLPLIGNVPAAGRTLAEFKADVDARLRSQVKTPHVVTSLAESKNQPVSVMGEVNTPGTFQMDGRRTLFDVLATAGGLKPDAGDVITITRQPGEGSLDLAHVVVDANSGSSVAEVSARDLMERRNPAVNITMRPHDEVSVSRGRVLYVIGNVKKPGGFTMSHNRPLSSLEALSLAEGLTQNAASGSARILRRQSETDTARIQIPCDLKDILKGKKPDMILQPDDILYIPDSTTKRFAAKAAETALATISGIVIWRGL